MSRFVNDLRVRLVNDADNKGRRKWELCLPLIYESDVAGKTITVPIGFKTDFASVPRLPVAYLLAGDTAHEAAVVHDFLYTSGEFPRATADDVLLEAMAVTGIPRWRRVAIYFAVRAFGGSHFINPTRKE
ncbi:MAG: DUF1353 domain-containing protein [Sulfuricellaceae bacterium]